ncbi:hypothetical protein BN1708_007690, partial [Verticillium longisporum]
HSRHISNFVGTAEVAGERACSIEGEEYTERDLNDERDAQGEDCRAEYGAEGAERDARAEGLYTESAAEVAPGVACERKGGLLEGKDGDHNETPADGVEDAPCCGVRCAEGDDGHDEPEIESVAHGRFSPGDEAWTEKDEQSGQGWAGGRGLGVLCVTVLAGTAPDKVKQADERRNQVAGELYTSLQVHGRLVFANVKSRDEEQVKDDIYGKLGWADDQWHIGLIEGPCSAFVENLDNDANVGVDIGSDDQGGVNVGDPELGKRAIKSR